MPTLTIGLLNESSLHAEIKRWYRQDNDILELKVDKQSIDIVRGERLIEIQIHRFYKIREKLLKLLPDHTIRLVYPIPVRKWISRFDASGTTLIGRRKSPKQNQLYHLFNELVYIPTLPSNPNFSLEVVLVEQEDIWIDDGKGSWRRKHWSVADRHLLAVIDRVIYTEPEDIKALLPENIPVQFSSRDIAKIVGISQILAAKMLYCLHKLNQVKLVGISRKLRIYSLE